MTPRPQVFHNRDAAPATAMPSRNDARDNSRMDSFDLRLPTADRLHRNRRRTPRWTSVLLAVGAVLATSSVGSGQTGQPYTQPYGQPSNQQTYGQPAPSYSQPGQPYSPSGQSYTQPYTPPQSYSQPGQPYVPSAPPAYPPPQTAPPASPPSTQTFPPTQFGPRTPPMAPPGAMMPGTGEVFPPVGTAPVYTPNVRVADLVVNGFPARTGRIMFGGAVNSDAGVTGQVTIDERNFDIMRWPRSFRDFFSGTAFRGAGQTFRLEAAPGSQFDRYSLQFADPNLFGYLPISFSSSGFLYDRRFRDWDENRLGARFSLGYRITPDLSIAVGIGGQNVEVDNIRKPYGGVPELNELEGNNELYSGTISLTHNTRDSPIQPSQGHYFELKFEETFGDFEYSRLEVEHRKYWLLASRADGSGKQTLSYSTQLGFSGNDTPVFEHFFAGGYATLRGFDFRGASPVVNDIEIGGQFQWLNSVEYMFPITADDAFRGVAFCDFGTVEQSVKLDADTFRVAPGVGLRVAIPALGPAPLAFDFAFPVAKADYDDERMFSFYMSLIR
ncbi:BamA/TamA family outer membrane protein [Roseiconus nitratireducens]|uniref:BamA/TamA family outer membrane protein n=1 Tax=Roseiconus nitratireducens TaxID=2605748 RepID=A0A5M6D3D3_9BACT|nr:BamA/TamA family outer membrane protein [Roseiconus nitratireducens]KAA5540229.1 BamA/TamA family outer membrane protein [Roseiconus nitratireducens]